MINLISGCICLICGTICWIKGNDTGIIVCMSSTILNFVLAAQQRH